MAQRTRSTALPQTVVRVRRDSPEQLLEDWIARQLKLVLDSSLPLKQRLIAWRRAGAVWGELKPQRGDRTNE
jgi:hypothetical protein